MDYDKDNGHNDIIELLNRYQWIIYTLLPTIMYNNNNNNSNDDERIPEIVST
jgi:hypothetical protein